MRKAIYEFFINDYNKPDDTLDFCFSGHGIPYKEGMAFLAPSDIDSKYPFKTGFLFDDLTECMFKSRSQCIVTILDCCYTSLKISKGFEKTKKIF